MFCFWFKASPLAPATLDGGSSWLVEGSVLEHDVSSGLMIISAGAIIVLQMDNYLYWGNNCPRERQLLVLGQ